MRVRVIAEQKFPAARSGYFLWPLQNKLYGALSKFLGSVEIADDEERANVVTRQILDENALAVVF